MTAPTEHPDVVNCLSRAELARREGVAAGLDAGEVKIPTSGGGEDAPNKSLAGFEARDVAPKA